MSRQRVWGGVEGGKPPFTRGRSPSCLGDGAEGTGDPVPCPAGIGEGRSCLVSTHPFNAMPWCGMFGVLRRSISPGSFDVGIDGLPVVHHNSFMGRRIPDRVYPSRILNPTITLRVPRDVREWVLEQARARGVKASNIVAQLLKQQVEAQQLHLPLTATPSKTEPKQPNEPNEKPPSR